MTLVLSAFAGELTAFIEALKDRKKYKISLGANNDIYYTCGLTKAGEQAAAAVTGIGKLNSYISTYELIKEYRPDRIIFAGISGAVDPELKIGDIVLSDSITQYDLDYLTDNVLPGRIPGHVEGLICMDKNLTAKIDTAVRTLQEREDFHRSFAVGCTGSADIFMTPDQLDRYADVLAQREVLAVDMEGYSAALAALARNIPFSQVRIISDEADGTKLAASKIREFLRSASCDLASIVDEMMF